ncbi:AAA family ATPase [Saccharothrix deserti]|uniref:AAA family ATPase n=1 Tax=Saccharothrix deserti TaxID=2593674 RepID=UPI00192E4AF4|nr:AAA family ATPase [Saccharothrix deserti]
MRAVRWTWQDRVPAGSLSLVPGREGIGKSQFACWLAAQVTNGTLPGALHGEPRPVIYTATEDSWAHTVAPRLAAADLDAVYRAEVDVDGIITGLTLPRDCEALGEEITARGVGLLILDPLLSAIGTGSCGRPSNHWRAWPIARGARWSGWPTSTSRRARTR